MRVLSVKDRAECVVRGVWCLSLPAPDRRAGRVRASREVKNSRKAVDTRPRTRSAHTARRWTAGPVARHARIDTRGTRDTMTQQDSPVCDTLSPLPHLSCCTYMDPILTPARDVIALAVRSAPSLLLSRCVRSSAGQLACFLRGRAMHAPRMRGVHGRSPLPPCRAARGLTRRLLHMPPCAAPPERRTGVAHARKKSSDWRRSACGRPNECDLTRPRGRWRAGWGARS